MSDEHTKDDASIDDASATEVNEVKDDEQAGARPRLRLRRSWAEIRSFAPTLAFVGWIGLVLLVALARVDPWNKSKSWRKWFRADERGWELFIPGILLAASTLLFIKSHDRWRDEGWSPEVVAMVLLATGAAVGGSLWALFCLGLRPFAG